jgi:DNA-binding protein YbaB
MQGNDELRKRLATMIGEMGRLREAQAELTQMLTDGEAADGLVGVTVGPTGALTNVRIDPRAMRLDSQTLAESILEAAQQATMRAGDKANELFAGLGSSLDMGGMMTSGAADAGTADPAAVFERLQKLIS